MKAILANVRDDLPFMLQSIDGWHSKLVEYHPPIVQRLWRQFGNYRISIHRIIGCKPHEAMKHTHPWPSIIQLIQGQYEMDFGFIDESKSLQRGGNFLMKTGGTYIINSPKIWHSVAPKGKECLTLMVTGKPWELEDQPFYETKPPKNFRQLTVSEASDLLRDFSAVYRGFEK